MPWKHLLKFNKEGEGGAGGSGGAAPTEAEKQLAEFKRKNEELESELKKFRESKPPGQQPPPPPKDETLSDKARKEQEEADKVRNHAKNLEAAIKFNLSAAEWLKTNEALLPKTVAGIFEAANKEKYNSPIEKDAAIKLGIVTEFFNQQSNVDLLTPALKQELEDFQNLTKNVKLERAQRFYDQVFEPTFENAKRVKKATELQKGNVTHSSAEEAFKKKMIERSKKHYNLGDK